MANSTQRFTTFVARNDQTYSLTKRYPDTFSCSSETAVSFAEILPGQRIKDPPSGIYHLLPRSELLALVNGKSEVSVAVPAGLKVSRATFQAYKQFNEDRTFVREFQHGLLFGVLDGHGGPDLSDYTANALPPLLAAAITTNLNDFAPKDGVPVAFRQAFAAYDASLSEFLKHFSSRPASEWTDVEVLGVLGPKSMQDEPNSIFGAARRAVLGTTALVGYMSNNRSDLWVASLGDSEACAGRLSADGTCLTTSLNDMHNTNNPTEISRIQAEHPGECVIKNKRLLGTLSVTRAFGDFNYKVDPMLGLRILCYAYPCPVPFDSLKEWCLEYKTPPYVSCEPSVRHHLLAPSDIVVFASDGIQHTNQLKDFDLKDRGKLLISLAGVQDGDPLEQWSNRIGHSFIPRCDGDNVAERVIHNILFGQDARKHGLP